MRVLVVSKIFPSAANPSFAPYNRYQFAALGKLCDVKVLGLDPWYPGQRLRERLQTGQWPPCIPSRESIDGLSVEHPRVAYLPVVGRPVSGLTYAISLLPHVVRYRGKVDVVLGAFAYPDGWAACAMGKLLRVPTVLKVHGGDINELRKSRWVEPSLRRALSCATHVIATSEALKVAACEQGARSSTAHVVLNGLDLDVFKVRDRAQCRQELGLPLEGRILLFVGRVETRKGVKELLSAFEGVSLSRPDVTLVMVGEGEALAWCKVEAGAKHLSVRFVGPRPHHEIGSWLGACDVFCLPSYAEGTPNVVMEALASGRRVVATAVGGIPAVMKDPKFGVLVSSHQVEPLASALASVLDDRYDPNELAASTTFSSWQDSAKKVFDILASAVHEGPR